MPYKIGPHTEWQLEGIYLYTYEIFGELQADSYRDRLFDTFERLAASPHLGMAIVAEPVASFPANI